MDPELQRISTNLQRLIAAGKEESVLLEYLRTEGFSSREQWRSALSAGQRVPEGSLLGGGARARSDAATAASNRTSNEPLTVRELLRLGAAGVIPGWSDEVVARLRSLSPSMTYEQALERERAGLASGRGKAGSLFVELAGGVLGGAGLGQVARGTGAVSRGVQAVTGLGRGTPQTALGGTLAGARTGAAVGALAGSGNEESGRLMDRLLGGAEGAVVGGGMGAFLGGATTAGMNRVTPRMDNADILEVFGPDTPRPSAERAVRETAESFRRTGVDPRAAEMRVLGDDIRPEYPLNVADLGGTGTRAQLNAVDRLSRGGAASEQIKTTLTQRAEQVAARQTRAIERATGRTTQAPAAIQAALRTEKRAVDDVMYGRARRAAAGTSRWVTRTTPELERALLDPEVVKMVDRGVKRQMQRGANSGRLAKSETFKDPYIRDKKGRIRGVKESVDPITLSEISRRLGGLADRAVKAGNRELQADLLGFRRAADDVLDVVPEFREANALSKRMNDRERALKAGWARGTTTSEGQMAEEVAAWRAAPLPVPADAQADIAARLGRAKYDSVPSAFEDFAQGQQAKRVRGMRRTGSAKPPSAELRDLDALAQGAGPAAQISKAVDVEREMAETLKSSPSARGNFTGSGTANANVEAANAAGGAIRDATLGLFGNLRLGAGLLAADAARAGLKSAARPSAADLMAEARGLLATDAQRDAMFRLIRDRQRLVDTPMRRGLFDASTYAGAGFLEP